MRLRPFALVTGLAATLAGSLHADGPLRIADIAPAGSFLVIGADGIDGSISRLGDSPLGGLWNTRAVQETIGEQMKEMLGDMAESLEDEGFEGEPKMPGGFGFAVYADLDEETGMSRAFVLGFAEWATDEEHAGRMFDFMVEQIEDGDDARTDRKEVRGREVMVVEQIVEEEMEGDDEFGGEFDAMMMFGNPDDFMPNLDRMYLVRDGGRILLANDLLAIDDALGTIDGDEGDHLADTDDWEQTTRQLGPADAYLVLRTGPLQQLLAPLFMGPLGLVKPMIGEVFGDVRSYGFGASVPEPGEVGMVLTASMLMPEGRQGLFSLIEGTGPVGQAPPAVVGGDAVGYGTIRVDFAKFVPLVERIAMAMPMGGEEIEMSMEQFGPMMDAGLATMGPEVHVISTVSRPIEVDSAATTLVIPTSDPKKVQPLLAMFGPGMDLEPRDFLGETIWSSEINGFASAVAGNWVVLGSPRGVEQVLRSLGNGGDGHPLAGVDQFNDAVAKLPAGDVVGWGWTDIVSQYAAQREAMKGMMDMLGAGAFDEFAPVDPAQADQLDFAADLMDSLTPEQLADHVGPAVWTFSTDDLGLVYRQWFLNPVK